MRELSQHELHAELQLDLEVQRFEDGGRTLAVGPVAVHACSELPD